MRTLLLSAFACTLALGAVPAQAAQNRCGLLDNPTPGNWWLTDRDGEWTIGVQMGHQAEGMENMPESLFEKGWVRTNGFYGYRCACLSVDTDPATHRVTMVHSAKALPMSRCKADKALQKVIRETH